MIINFILLIIFLASFFIVWCRVSQRIPKLAVVSDEAIASYLKEESSRLHFFVIEIKSFYKDKKYKEWLRIVWAKLLYRFHILLLRVDNKVTLVLKDLRAMDIKTTEPKDEGISASSVATDSTAKHLRIQEVRIRKRKNRSGLFNSPE